MSPGRCARLPGMFSTHGTKRRHRDRRLQLRKRPHRADHGRAARHVVLHLLHAVGRLDGDAAGVEGDALADQAQVAPWPLRRSPGGSAARSGTGGSALPCATPSSAPMPSCSHAVAVQHFALQARLRRPSRARARPAACGVRRLAGSLTSSRAKFCASADDAAALQRRFEPGAVAHRHREHAPPLFCSVLVGLVAVRLEVAQRGRLRPPRRRTRRWPVPGPARCVRDRFALQDAAPPRRPACASRRRRTLALAGPGHQQALGAAGPAGRCSRVDLRRTCRRTPRRRRALPAASAKRARASRPSKHRHHQRIGLDVRRPAGVPGSLPSRPADGIRSGSAICLRMAARASASAVRVALRPRACRAASCRAPRASSHLIRPSFR